MWKHLKRLHHQTNRAWKFYLDTEMAKYCQGDKRFSSTTMVSLQSGEKRILCSSTLYPQTSFLMPSSYWKNPMSISFWWTFALNLSPAGKQLSIGKYPRILTPVNKKFCEKRSNFSPSKVSQNQRHLSPLLLQTPPSLPQVDIKSNVLNARLWTCDQKLQKE